MLHPIRSGTFGDATILAMTSRSAVAVSGGGERTTLISYPAFSPEQISVGSWKGSPTQRAGVCCDTSEHDAYSRQHLL